jgi:WD40 repeat protein
MDHTGPVNGVAFSPDSRRVVSACSDRLVRVWNTAGGETLGRLRGHDINVTCIAFSADGLHLVTGSEDGRLHVWDVQLGVVRTQFHGHHRRITIVAISPDGRKIVSASDDSFVKLWDLGVGWRLVSPSLSWVDLARRFVRSIRRLVGGPKVLRLSGHLFRINTVAFSPDSELIATGAEDRTIRLWCANTGLELACLRGHERGVDWVAFSSDGRRLLSTGRDRTVRTWDSARGDCLDVRAMDIGSAPTDRELIHPRLRTASTDRETVIESTATGEPVAWFPVPLQGITAAPQGRTLAGTYLGRLYLIRLEGE